MDAPLISPGTTVAETLKEKGQTSRVFVQNKTACVGCSLAQFCTLEDVAKTYGLPLELFLNELQRSVQTNPSLIIGVKDEKNV
ncbi:MAG TPA: hypothetical protein VHM28_06780 [Anaerolineales bacterium]|nr:hypothetical protein [Anaerolineales bacterium]